MVWGTKHIEFPRESVGAVGVVGVIGVVVAAGVDVGVVGVG